jgi:hypothetical protein
MSLIHTCELYGANPFDYLSELQRHAGELARTPTEWMPWSYRDMLLSNESSYVTGSHLICDGGVLAKASISV